MVVGEGGRSTGVLSTVVCFLKKIPQNVSNYVFVQSSLFCFFVGFVSSSINSRVLWKMGFRLRPCSLVLCSSSSVYSPNSLVISSLSLYQSADLY